MAVDIATLAIAVDATQARVAALELDKLKKSGESAEKQMSSMKNIAGELASKLIGQVAAYASLTFVVDKLASSILGGVEAMAKMKDLGHLAGTTAEGISKFEQAARMSGTSLDEVSQSIFMMNRSLMNAKDASSEAAQAYKSIGLNVKDLLRLKPEDQFVAVAKALDKYGESAEKNSVKQTILGRAGFAQGKMLKEIAEAGELSATVTNKQADAADALSDRVDLLKLSFDQQYRALAAELLPTFNNMLNALTTLMSHFSNGGSKVGIFKNVLTGLSFIVGGAALFMKDLGDEIGAMMAKAEAFATLDFSAWKAINADRQKSQAENSAAFGLLWRQLNGTVTEADKAALALRNVVIPDGTSSQGQGSGENKPKIKFNPAASKTEDEYKRLADSIASATRAAELELETGQKLSSAEKALTDIRNGEGEAVKKLTEAQLLNIEVMLESQIAVEKALVAKQKELDIAQHIQDAYVKEREGKEAARIAAEQYQESLQNEIEDYQFSLQLLGRSQEEQARMTALRKIDLDMRNAILALPPDNGNDAIMQANIDAIERIKKAAELAKATMANLMPRNDGIKEMTDRLTLLQRASQGFGSAITAALGNLGSPIKGVIDAVVNLGQKQVEIAQRQKQSIAEAHGDAGKIAKISKQAADEMATAQVSAFGDMAAAAKGFFEQGSRGYAALQAAEKVFRAFEAAKSAEIMAMKLGEILGITSAKVSGDAVKAASDTTYTDIAIANAAAEGTANAAAGVANQANGDPYTAFVRMAAMAAVMAALGFAVGGVGGSAGGNTSAADRQASQGTGTVFGDSKAKSESIARSIEILSKFAELDYGISNDMLSSLRQIASSMGSFVTFLVRNIGGALTGRNNGYDNLGLNLGSSKSFLGFSRTSTSVTDSGIMSGAGQTVGSVISAGFVGQSYVDTQTTKSSFFGMRKKTSNNTVTSDLSSDIQNQFTQIIADLRSTVLAALDVFGEAGTDFASLLDGLAIDFGKISFKDMTGKEIEETVNAVFSNLGDQMVNAVLPGVSAFAKVGEGTLETLTRLAADYKTVDLVFARMGQTFGAVGWASVGARESLIAFTGGIEEFTKKADFYFQNFYTEAEQLGATSKRVGQEFARLGITGVATIEQFRTTMDSIKASADFTKLTPAGDAARKLYADLLNLAPAFYDVANAVRNLVSDIQGAATDIYGSGLGKEFAQANFDATSDAWNAYLVSKGLGGASQTSGQTYANFSNVQYVKDTLEAIRSGKIDAEGAALYRDLVNSYRDLSDMNKEAATSVSYVQESFENLKQPIDDLAKQLLDARDAAKEWLKSILLNDQLSILSPGEKLAEAATQYKDTLAKANSGDAKAAGNVTQIAEQYLQIARAQYGSGAEYAAVFTQVYDQIGKFADPSGKLNFNDAMLAALPNNSPLASQEDIQNLTQALRNYLAAVASGNADQIAEQNEILRGIPIGLANAQGWVIRR